MAIEPSGREIAEALGPGSSQPEGHRFVTLAERPDLRAAVERHNGSVWPPFRGAPDRRRSGATG